MQYKLFIFILSYLLIFYCPVNAQGTGKPELEITGSVDFGLNEGYPLGGFGSNVKLLWPVGQKNNSLTATLGFDKLYEDLHYDAYSYTFLLTSIGYRRNLQSFFIEPKAGFGFCGESRDRDFSAFIGIEPGIQKRRFSYSIAYRFISVDGIAYGDHFHTFALRFGYKIFSDK